MRSGGGFDDGEKPRLDELDEQDGRGGWRTRPRVLIMGMSLTLLGSGLLGVGWAKVNSGEPVSQGQPLPAVPIVAASTPSTHGATAKAAESALSTPAASTSPAASPRGTRHTPVVTLISSSKPPPVTAATTTVAAAAPTTAVAQAPVDTNTPPSGYGTTDLALGRPVTATSYVETYAPANLTDGSVDSYWEGAQNSFPQRVTVDLGSVQWVAKIELALPPASDWNSRTQTIAIYGSPSGTNPTQTLVASTGYTFNANDGTDDAVTVTFTPVDTRYLILDFTANSGWYAAQLSELFAYS